MNRIEAGTGSQSATTALVWSSLMMLALARGAATFIPSMWAWGINIQRFLPPPAAWLLWGLPLLVLYPPVGERVAGRLGWIGDRLLSGAGLPWAAAVAVACLVWFLPDRTWFTGDFQLRQMAADTGALAGNFAQSLPGELLLDRVTPLFFASFSPMDPNVALRAIGAAAAGALAVVGLGLVRSWGLTGAAAATSAGIIVFGGYLTAFTGLGKPAAVMCPLVAMVVLGCTRVIRDARGGGFLGFSLAIAVLTHRGALFLLPAWLAALFLAFGHRRPLDRHARREIMKAMLPPLLAGVAVAPRVWQIVQSLDIPRHIAPATVQRTGVLAAAFAPRHLLDLANLVVLYTPAIVVLLALRLRRGPVGRTGPEGTLLNVLAASFIPLMLFLHPMQGVVRDLEVFAIAGLSLAILAAYSIGMALQRRSLPKSIAPALLLAVLAPSLQWLLHFHDPGRGFERVKAIAVERPTRSDEERARLWDFVAYSAFRREKWDWAVEASEEVVRYSPHPRALMMLAIARTYTGDDRGAESLYVDLATRSPGDPLVWVGLGGSALRMGDSLEFRRAIARLETYGPQSHEARAIRRHLEIFPRVWPTRGELDAVPGP